MKNTFFFIALVLLFPTLLTAQTKVNFYTTKGNFVVTLEDTLAPITAGNFKKLVKEKYYDGVIFHRIIQNFVIQGGDGAAGKLAIQDEFHPNLSNLQWTLSMANSGPNTGTTQFFINLKDNTFLDYDKANQSIGILTTTFLSAIALYFSVEKPDQKKMTIIDLIFIWFYIVNGVTVVSCGLTSFFDESIFYTTGTILKTLVPLSLISMAIYLYKRIQRNRDDILLDRDI